MIDLAGRVVFGSEGEVGDCWGGGRERKWLRASCVVRMGCVRLMSMVA